MDREVLVSLPLLKFWFEIALLLFEKPNDKLSWQHGGEALSKLPRLTISRHKGNFLLSSAFIQFGTTVLLISLGDREKKRLIITDQLSEI